MKRETESALWILLLMLGVMISTHACTYYAGVSKGRSERTKEYEYVERMEGVRR